ncbi:MAG: aminotransferase class I/II-fold pyridoxal phosphate-dependent enzyme, partial [Planctomycetota bacterium]
EIEYAVRGPIPQRAAELAKAGRRTIACNIGNPQALGQRPISFYRQVLSLLETPSRIGRERAINKLRAADPSALAGLGEEDFVCEYVLGLCDDILAKLPTGTGAYTESKGPLFIREAIARYIDHRDGVAGGQCATGGRGETSGEGAAGGAGVPSNPEDIFLTNGASEAAKYLIDMMIADRNDGIMIPIPQYPLYSAAIRKAGGVQVNYYPDEDNGWTLDRSILEAAYDGAVRQGVTVKAIVVINPANPTGAIMPRQSIQDVVDFAMQRGLPVIADEVYQHNLYGATFDSFAKVVGEAPLPLFSLHSTSKGFYGECGHRGGYVEVRNAPKVRGSSLGFTDVLLKLASISLCSNTIGQVLTYLMVSPPPEGSEPYEQFVREKEGVLGELYQKAVRIREALAEMDGVECFGRTGAMYLFPRLNKLPAGTGDFEYCMALLESTGLCTVNGSGFGQKEGTHHLRIAFLPPRDLLERVLPEWVAFHNEYVARA